MLNVFFVIWYSFQITGTLMDFNVSSYIDEIHSHVEVK